MATIVVAPNDAGRTVEVEILDEELVIADEGRCYRVLLSGAIAAAAEDRDRNFDHLGCLVDWAAPTLQEHPERVTDLTADTSTRSDLHSGRRSLRAFVQSNWSTSTSWRSCAKSRKCTSRPRRVTTVSTAWS